MKKAILILTFSFAALWTMAQTELGFKGGYQVTNITIDGISGLIPDTDYMDNFQVGLTAYVPLRNGFGFKPELLLVQKGFIIAEDFDVTIFDFDVPIGAEARTRIKYIEAPLLLEYRSSSNPVHWYLEVGPIVGYAVDADVRTRLKAIVDINIADSDINLSNDIYNRWEIGGAVGAGLGIPLSPQANLNIGARYQHSISDLLNDPIIDVRGRNYGFSATMGMSFKI